MDQTSSPPYFFIHVMKTGGATFRQHVYANCGEGEVYPRRKHDDMNPAWLVQSLFGLPDSRRAQIKAYLGHYPYVVTEMMGIDLVTITLLREPVDRTISYLKHCKRYHEQHRELSLEAIYDDKFYFQCFIHNHQSKIFSMTPSDSLVSYMDIIDVDARRLATSKRNLEKVDVVGLTESYDEFLAEIRKRFGWQFGRIRNRHVSKEPWDVSAAFRRHIAEQNAADMEFYEFARQLIRRRRC